jgi:inner membrane protein
VRAVDSVTHLVVGATLGQLLGGRQLGRKALLWGALLGSLPDADVLALPWLSEIQQLEWHRGFMHSLLFLALAAPLFGALIARIHRDKITFRAATLLAVAALLSHLLLDCCTVYGTEIFQPFSSARIAWNNLFIIDPLFTLPFAVATLLLLPRRFAKARQSIAAAALLLGCAYLGWSFSAKSAADRAFEKAFAAQHLEVRRYMTAPAPLNTILWRAVAEGPGGYWIGYHSLLDGGRAIRFRYVERGEESLGPLADTPAVRTIQWFSNGYWLARDLGDGTVRLADLRFGETNIAMLRRDPEFFFAWRVIPVATGSTAQSLSTPRGPLRPLFGALRRRILGETSPLWPL